MRKSILLEFQNAGFLPHRQSLACHQCYAESMNQYVVNYDLSVFKCTARDFSAIHSVGKIADGVFIPNSHYFDYSIPTDVIDEQCKECQLLPSCLGRCVQKRVEGSAKNCDKDSLRLSVINDVLLYMNANER